MRNHLIMSGVLALGLWPATTLAQAPAPASPNKQVVQDALDAIQRQDYNRFRELTREDAVIHVTGAPEPLKIDRAIDLLKSHWKAFPDTSYILDQLLAEGDQLAARLTYQCTHRGTYEGVPATDHWIAYSGVHFFRLEQGRICEWWIMNDHLGRMQQLGSRLALPDPPKPPPLTE